MFIWSSVAHLALPLGSTGVQEISNEPAVLNALQVSLGDRSGLYLYPGMGLAPDASRQQKNAAMQGYEQKLAASPSGLLIYHPPGETGMTARRLATEFLSELCAAFIAVFLLAQTRLQTYSARLGFVSIAGILGSLLTNVSYWNWYGFPANYTLAYMLSQIAGFVCAGLVAAAILRTSSPRALTAAA